MAKVDNEFYLSRLEADGLLDDDLTLVVNAVLPNKIPLFYPERQAKNVSFLSHPKERGLISVPQETWLDHCKTQQAKLQAKNKARAAALPASVPTNSTPAALKVNTEAAEARLLDLETAFPAMAKRMLGDYEFVFESNKSTYAENMLFQRYVLKGENHTLIFSIIPSKFYPGTYFVRRTVILKGGSPKPQDLGDRYTFDEAVNFCAAQIEHVTKQKP